MNNQNKNIPFTVQIPVEFINALQAHQANFVNIEREIAKAKQAGLDMSEIEKAFSEAKSKAQKILNVYGKP